MNRIEFDFEPLEIATSDVEAVRATMARLTIRIDGQCITRVFDKRARTIRDSVTTALYPIAEWIAANWWFLQNECWTPGRAESSRGFQSRHSLSFAGDGFAYPDLRFVPEGRGCRLTWNTRRTLHQNVDFLNYGDVWIPHEEFQGALHHFVASVIDRLDAMGVGQTYLHQEWASVGETSSDADLREFCATTAALGIDPFAATEAESDAIESAYARLGDSIRDDFFSAADFPRIEPAIQWIESTALEVPNFGAKTQGFWSSLREDLRPSREHGAFDEPWQQGYRFARRCRQLLNVANEPAIDDQRLGGGLPIVSAPPPPMSSFDAMMRPETGSQMPVCCTAKGIEASRRFVFFRGLYDYLNDIAPVPRLLTASQTFRQQAGRAFAAEFLAPSHLLKVRLPAAEAGDDEVAELASEFRVSEYVIRHQIKNHDIARLVTATI